jgi:sugar phosphate permease
MAGLSLFLAYRADGLTLSLVGLSSAAFFMYGGLGPFGAIVLDLAPERSRAAYSGVVNTAGQIGGAAAPVIVGFLVDATGTFAGGFDFMVVGLCVAAACLLAVVPLLSGKANAAMAAV